MKPSVLLVDDEPRVVDGLRRMLRPMRRRWEMAFASSGEEALEIVRARVLDVVVTDMRMPGIDGAALLQEVVKRRPGTMRIVLSGQTSREEVLKTLGLTHLYLSKPCDPEVLRAAIERALKLGTLVADRDLRALVTRMRNVPSPPEAYRAITAELERPEPSMRRASDIIAGDAGMTAKILQVANSALFGSRGRVVTPRKAVIHLGLEMVRTLVVCVHIFSALTIPSLQRFGIGSLWAHSLGTSALARVIAREEGWSEQFTDEVSTGALLHDVGKLILAANLPEEYVGVYRDAREREVTIQAAEQDHFGTTHAEIGAYLAGLWGLPEPLIGALAFHHCPARQAADELSPPTVIHVADYLEQEDRPHRGGARRPVLDGRYLSRLGFENRLPVWRALRKAAATASL